MPADMKTGRPAVVMQVLPSLVSGGVERGSVDVAIALRTAGYRAIVVSQGGRMVRELERVGAEHITMPVASKNIFQIFCNAVRLTRLVKTERVDIIHARSRAPAWSALWASRWSGCPFVTTFHGTYNFSNGIKRWYNAVMTRSDRVIAVSDFIRRHILRHYSVDSSLIRTIPRGVDSDLYEIGRAHV